MLRRTGLCFLLILNGFVAFAIRALPAYTVFYLPATGGKPAQPYIEVYWQINPNTVQFNKDEKELWRGKIKTEIKVYNDSAVLAEDKYYLQTTPAASVRAALMQNIMDLHRYVVLPGKTYFTLRLSEDGNPNSVFEYTDSVTVAPPVKIFYSGIQLVDTAYKTDIKDNMFLKNDVLQVPLCANFLDDHRKFLHYYAELYGTHTADTSVQPLVQQSFVSKKEYEYPVYGLTATDTIAGKDVLPMNGSFKIDVLPSGNYYLNIILRSKDGREIAKKAIFFQRSNAKPVVTEDTMKSDSTGPVFEKVEVFDLSKTFVAKYKPAQLMAILKMLLPIASADEAANIKAFLERPEETYMRYFIYNFWKNRSPSDVEKGWEQYADKVKEVNRLFGAQGNPGYETDRGFYYLKYGPPNQRFTVSNEEGARPYEVWVYNSPGKQGSQGAFLFYSPAFMFNEFRLLHSTVLGELRNNAWRQELYMNGASSNNLNSRAEQYFP